MEFFNEFRDLDLDQVPGYSLKTFPEMLRDNNPMWSGTLEKIGVTEQRFALVRTNWP